MPSSAVTLPSRSSAWCSSAARVRMCLGRHHYCCSVLPIHVNLDLALNFSSMGSELGRVVDCPWDEDFSTGRDDTAKENRVAFGEWRCVWRLEQWSDNRGFIAEGLRRGNFLRSDTKLIEGSLAGWVRKGGTDFVTEADLLSLRIANGNVTKCNKSPGPNEYSKKVWDHSNVWIIRA